MNDVELVNHEWQKHEMFSLFLFRSSDESVILLRNFIDSFQGLKENDEDNEEEGVYHRVKRNGDRGVT